jgi:hypothetical protein
MATSEDDAAKHDVQEAVWTWAGRFVVVAAVFVLGLMAGFWSWGYGPQGAVHLRTAVVELQNRYDAVDKKRVDIEGKYTVIDSRLTQCAQNLQACGADLQKARAGQAAQP